MMWRFVLVLYLGLASSACAGTTHEFPATGSETGKLRIEASGDIEAIGPLIQGFQETEPGLAVTYVDSLTNELYAGMQKVCDSGAPAADLVFSSSVDHMVKLANDGCAQAHVSAETRRMPDYARWRDEVFGFTFEPAVIVYNRERVSPSEVPTSRDRLADLLRGEGSKFAGRIGTYDIARSGIGYLFAFFDAQQSSDFGRLMEGFARANAELHCCTGELLDRIETGELLIGYNLLGSYAYGRYKAGAPIGIVLPRDYTLVLSRAAFVPRRAANPDAGKRFLDYLLSPRGQKLAAESAFFFAFGEPIPPGVEAAEPEIQASAFRPIPIGPSLFAVSDGQNRKRLLKEWTELFGRR